VHNFDLSTNQEITTLIDQINVRMARLCDAESSSSALFFQMFENLLPLWKGQKFSNI